jgi:glycosyltransferase involved in cell wall biosynthesis
MIHLLVAPGPSPHSSGDDRIRGGPFIPRTQPSEMIAVAFVTPAWPREQASSVSANGITSYVHNISHALRERHDCKVGILAHQVFDGQSDGELLDVSPIDSKQSGRRSLSELILDKLNPNFTFHRRVAGSILRNTNRLALLKGLDILQMEESFGWARFVVPHSLVPVVVRTHGPWFVNGQASGVPNDRKYRNRVRCEGKAIQVADGVTAPSADILERVRAHYELPLPHAMVIPNPIRLALESDRWSYEACERNTILFVGRFDLHKGGDLLIDAYVKLLEQRPECRLIFAGPNAGLISFDQKLVSILEYLKSKHHVSVEGSRIEICGVQSSSRLRELRKKAFLTVVPSRYETFGNVLTEAMSQGCPLVASDAGGMKEVMSDGYSGLQFRAGDAVELARKLLKLFDEPDLAVVLGRQAMLECASKYNYTHIAEQTVGYYRDVISRWKRDQPSRARRRASRAASPKTRRPAEPVAYDPGVRVNFRNSTRP